MKSRNAPLKPELQRPAHPPWLGRMAGQLGRLLLRPLLLPSGIRFLHSLILSRQKENRRLPSWLRCPGSCSRALPAHATRRGIQIPAWGLVPSWEGHL